MFSRSALTASFEGVASLTAASLTSTSLASTSLTAASLAVASLVIASLGVACAPARPREPGPAAAGGATLAELASDATPYLHVEASSEQRQPVYFGARPREIVLGIAARSSAKGDLPRSLATLGEAQIAQVAEAARAHATPAPRGALEIETWPVRDDDGRLTWATARFRERAGAWRWLDAAWLAPETRGDDADPRPMLPAVLEARHPRDAHAVFDDALAFDSLYRKPAFGDCVWTRRDGGAVDAWLPPAHASAVRDALGHGSRDADVCRAIGQVARWNGAPFVTIVAYDPSSRRVTWPGAVGFRDDAVTTPAPARDAARVGAWPADFEAKYRADVLALDGEADAVFPRTGARVRFTRRESADPGNQLELVADYLEERYTTLGIATHRDRFTWRGIPQSNVIAKIHGTGPNAGERPVILADHVDTAFSESRFASTRKRVAAPGADDDATGTAALLRAAEVLRARRPARDVWLVHLTGEEFPGDDLGARRFVSQLLQSRQDVSGVVVLDMIGYRDAASRATKERPIFQVNAGEGDASIALAGAALGAAESASPGLAPAFRSRFDPRSYLYNTDGLIFSDAGYPIVLLNEHINRLEHLDRPHYHELTDTSATLDFDYAASIAKVAIELVARIAGVPADPAGAGQMAPIDVDVLAVPPVRQKTPYSCGDAAALGVLRFWRGATFDAVDEKALYAPLHTTKEDGTDPAPMARYIGAQPGLIAEYRRKTRRDDVALFDIERAIDRGEPPIIDIQAWRDIPTGATPAPWDTDWDDGHYVVAVAYDDTRITFMDPSNDAGYGYIDRAELLQRWHDVEGKSNTHVEHMAIFTRARPSSRTAPPKKRVTATRIP